MKVNDWRGVYVAEKAPVATYQLNINVVVSFDRVVSGSEPTILPFNAYLIPGFAVSASSIPLMIDGAQVTKVEQYLRDETDKDNTIYDLTGRRVYNPQKGVVYIKGGKKVIY